MRHDIKKYKRNIGLTMIYFGVSVLLLCFVCGWTKYNIVIFPILFLIIIGLILHVLIIKRESKY